MTLMPTDTELDVHVEQHHGKDGMQATAVFDSLRRTYRYLLTRVWDPTLPMATFLMLNPSTAGAAQGDATIRRIAGETGFARGWGMGGVAVVNLFALCSTDPARLRTHPDPVGRYNPVFVRQAVRQAGAVVTAWGAGGVLAGRGAEMARLLHESGVRLQALGFTSTGQPRHPLYLPSAAQLVDYVPEGS